MIILYLIFKSYIILNQVQEIISTKNKGPSSHHYFNSLGWIYKKHIWSKAQNKNILGHKNLLWLPLILHTIFHYNILCVL